jgi:hypothetical protein
MRLLSLAVLAAFAYITPSKAQGVHTVVVYVTVPRPSSTPASAAIIPQAVSTDSEQQGTLPTLSPSSSDVRSSSPSSTLTSTSQSAHQATSSETLPVVTAAASTSSDYYEPGPSSPEGGGIDTEGGASGSDAAAFRLSKGGLAAILIVVILVSLFGSKYDAFHYKGETDATQLRASFCSSSPNVGNGPCAKLSHGLLAA